LYQGDIVKIFWFVFSLICSWAWVQSSKADQGMYGTLGQMKADPSNLYFKVVEVPSLDCSKIEQGKKFGKTTYSYMGSYTACVKRMSIDTGVADDYGDFKVGKVFKLTTEKVFVWGEDEEKIIEVCSKQLEKFRKAITSKHKCKQEPQF
jgi:hypothetical protein